MGYPAPSDLPQEYTAAQLVAEIRERGGRLHRMREVCVVCLTTSEETAEWLRKLGGKLFTPPGLTPELRGPRGGYVRDRETGLVEWDIYVHTIEVTGDESIWEAAAPVEASA